MSDTRKSFVFYSDWYDAICGLDDATALEVSKAIMAIALGREEPNLSATANAMMMLIRPQIQRDIEKWIDIRNKRQEIGRMGGVAKATNCYQKLPNDSKSKQNLANEGVNVNVNDNVDVDNNVILEKEEDKSSPKKKTTRFVKPTIEEIQKYIEEKNYHIDAESFFNFYESKGWVVGKSPMKDWRAACRTWEKTWKDSHPQELQHDLFTNAEQQSDDMVINGQIYR